MNLVASLTKISNIVISCGWMGLWAARKGWKYCQDFSNRKEKQFLLSWYYCLAVIRVLAI